MRHPIPESNSMSLLLLTIDNYARRTFILPQVTVRSTIYVTLQATLGTLALGACGSNRFPCFPPKKKTGHIDAEGLYCGRTVRACCNSRVFSTTRLAGTASARCRLEDCGEPWATIISFSAKPPTRETQLLSLEISRMPSHRNTNIKKILRDWNHFQSQDN